MKGNWNWGHTIQAVCQATPGFPYFYWFWAVPDFFMNLLDNFLNTPDFELFPHKKKIT